MVTERTENEIAFPSFRCSNSDCDNSFSRREKVTLFVTDDEETLARRDVRAFAAWGSRGIRCLKCGTDFALPD